MKRIHIVFAAVLFLSVGAFAKPKGHFLNMRFLGAAGQNLGADSPAYSNKMAANADLDLLFNIGGSGGLNTSFGVKLGYAIMGKVLDESINYFQVSLVTEIEYRNFIFQFGAGPYSSLGDHNTQFGFLLGAGYDIPLTQTFSIPLLIRSDFLEESQISLVGQFGLSIYF